MTNTEICKCCLCKTTDIGRHLRNKHSITVDKYLRLYYNADNITCKCGCGKLLFSKKILRLSKFKVKYISGHNEININTRRLISKNLKKSWMLPTSGFNNRKKHSMTQEQINQRNIKIKNAHATTETKSKLSTSMKKLYSDTNYKSYWHKCNTEKNICKKFNVKSMTKLEKKMQNILDDLKIQYVFNYRLENKFYDFKVKDKNILIEVDGEYWHRQQGNIVNDFNKDVIAKQHNYILIRIKECMFSNVNDIKQTINNMVVTNETN